MHISTINSENIWQVLEYVFKQGWNGGIIYGSSDETYYKHWQRLVGLMKGKEVDDGQE